MGIYQGDICLTQGKTGKSAYQYAVNGGYTGTEAEYAALVANIGMKGQANGVASLNSNTKVPDGQLGISSDTANKYFASPSGMETIDQVLSLLGAAALKNGSSIKDALGNLITLPSAQLDSRVQIATGSYIGTGTYGSSNPTSIVFSFAPQIIILPGLINGSTYYQPNGDYGRNLLITNCLNSTNYIQGAGLGINGGSYGSLYAKKSTDGKTIYWYNTSAAAQSNDNGGIFYYVAIG